MRLDKYLADMNIGSRRDVKGYIKKGLVTVNGELVKSDKLQIDEKKDAVTFDGKLVSYQKYFYYMLNKPAGVVSATTDKHDRTVMDLFHINDYREDLFPVGRLDKDTEGLLIITNDGVMSHNLLSPKKHVPKKYFAKVSGIMTNNDIKAFEDGLTIDKGELCLPAQLEILSINEQEGVSEISLVLHEGKFHQVKRMVKAVGKEVTYLKRLSMGSLVLDESLELGAYKELSEQDLELLNER